MVRTTVQASSSKPNAVWAGAGSSTTAATAVAIAIAITIAIAIAFAVAITIAIAVATCRRWDGRWTTRCPALVFRVAVQAVVSPVAVLRVAVIDDRVVIATLRRHRVQLQAYSTTRRPTIVIRRMRNFCHVLMTVYGSRSIRFRLAIRTHDAPPWGVRAGGLAGSRRPAPLVFYVTARSRAFLAVTVPAKAVQ